jgi:hypothetical protein
MAELDQPDFKFPDEAEAAENSNDAEILLEIEDDTPVEDQGKDPLPEQVREELYKDELEDYSTKVKRKLLQMKKLAHDERREKEQAFREQQEAIALAQKVLQENNRLKSNLHERERDVLASIQHAIDLELGEAKRAYREAYESGETDRIIEAQERMTAAAFKAEKVRNYTPTPPEPEYKIPERPAAQSVPVDQKAASWKEKNAWFGDPNEEEMTSLALGMHEKLKKEGVVISSPEYYRRIDETMRKRFPEKFESDTEFEEREVRSTRTSSVVAPATRSTAPKKVRLSTTQVALAKKLGITPERYAQEVLKLES